MCSCYLAWIGFVNAAALKLIFFVHQYIKERDWLCYMLDHGEFPLELVRVQSYLKHFKADIDLN
jgi:hypothetical protein